MHMWKLHNGPLVGSNASQANCNVSSSVRLSKDPPPYPFAP